jgi:hypothetical protein
MHVTVIVIALLMSIVTGESVPRLHGKIVWLAPPRRPERRGHANYSLNETLRHHHGRRRDYLTGLVAPSLPKVLPMTNSYLRPGSAVIMIPLLLVCPLHR